LKTTSVLRLHKLATIHSSSVVRHLGNLSPAMTLDVKSKLRALLDI
jgi:mRNA-degrading endonuclease toxin of MazEF toxin-antitoxin module